MFSIAGRAADRLGVVQVSCHRPECAAGRAPGAGRRARAGQCLKILHKTSRSGDDVLPADARQTGQGFPRQRIPAGLRNEILRLALETAGQRYMETTTR
ncbi:hypothetical protein BVI1335_370009 [Burkholderia vietnamiensis]|nr:hypothetical protein BVI1335_370009 [Burkholderia vietnamiensis]